MHRIIRTSRQLVGTLHTPRRFSSIYPSTSTRWEKLRNQLPENNHPLWMIFGSFVTFAGSIVGSIGGAWWATERAAQYARDEQEKTRKEQEKHDKIAAENEAHEIRELLDSALHLLKCARTEYLRHAERGYILHMLEKAGLQVDEAESVLLNSDRKELVLQQIQDISRYNDLFAHLRAHIAYHKAAVELRSESSQAVENALQCIAESAVLRKSVSTGSQTSRHVKNELARTEIKLADVYSRQGKAEIAVSKYDQIAPDTQPDNLFISFWKIRATNNSAVVDFGRGRDKSALVKMENVARSAAMWLKRKEDGLVISKSELSKVKEVSAQLLQLLQNQTLTQPASPQLLRLINMGADDAVDVLHLWAYGGREAVADSQAHKVLESEATKHHIESLQTSKQQALAIEYLERVKLMLRKFYTSRANCLMIASVPFSNALEGDAKIAKLQRLLMDMMQQPLGEHSLLVYSVLDNDWITQEGTTRLFSAVAGALTELVAENAFTTQQLRDQALELASKLVKEAFSRHSHDLPPLPDAHSCMVSLAKARLLEVHFQDFKEALSALSQPASSKFLSLGVLAWSTQNQLKAKGIAEEQKQKSLFVSGIIPPRTARWQVSVVAYASYLQARCKTKCKDEEAKAMQSVLAFALIPFPDNHPIRLRSRLPLPIQSDMINKNQLSELDAETLLQSIESWQAAWLDAIQLAQERKLHA